MSRRHTRAWWPWLAGLAAACGSPSSGDDTGTGGAASETSGGMTATSTADGGAGPGGADGMGPGTDDAADDTNGPATAGDDGGNGDGLGPATFDEGELDRPSHGGTITFSDIGAPGWYPSRRDPAVGPCDAYQTDSCCLAHNDVTSDALTPWDEDLILTLRGPMQLKQLAVYQPTDGPGSAWSLVSGWDAAGSAGVAFSGNDSEAGFDGAIGTECLVDVSTDSVFPCGDGSLPYCPASDGKHLGWAGSKLLVVLARMPHADETPAGDPCSEGTGGNWWDAPWLGLSLGELVRAGAFSDCQCYAKDPAQWWLGDGCGQFNVFEVVNDNNEFANLDVFSTNFFGYAGYVGEGPCGAQCDVSVLGGDVDLIDKSANAEAAGGAESNPQQGPGAAFRRPAAGYRYFVILLDVASRRVQLAVIHPQAIPSGAAAVLPNLPATVSAGAIEDLLALRLPQ